MDEATLAATRRSLHGVAELVIAGPQYRSAGAIELRVRGEGIGGAVSDLLVTRDGLSGPGGLVPLSGTCRALAEAQGLEVSGLSDVYADGSGVDPDEPLTVDAGALEVLLAAFRDGDAALRRFAADLDPVLWPEHFDVAVTVDEVNYGMSPGDEFVPTPYAYVGPWRPRTGEFWNAPFGAALPMTELPDVDAVVAFFEEGRRRSHLDTD